MYTATYRFPGIRNAKRIPAGSLASAKRRASEEFDTMGADVELLILDEGENIVAWRKTSDFRWNNGEYRSSSS